MLRLHVLAFTLVILFAPALAEASAIKIIAAENFYGDIASQIGGANVKVKSVLNNPSQDPHLFEASPSLARDLAEADLVIFNGVDYDPWMEKLLAATPSSKRKVIVAAEVAGRKAGDNPHLWYDFAVSKAVAKAVAENLSVARPAQAEYFKKQEVAFEQALGDLQGEVQKIARAHGGTSVAATEPVFGYMLESMGLDVREKRFQLAVMNDAEPAVSDVAQFEDDLKGHVVKLLIYNKQATDPVADKLLALAEAQNIPVVAVTETQPEGTSFQQWLSGEIGAVAKALENTH